MSAFVILFASKSKELTSHSCRNDSIETFIARSQLQIEQHKRVRNCQHKQKVPLAGQCNVTITDKA